MYARRDDNEPHLTGIIKLHTTRHSLALVYLHRKIKYLNLFIGKRIHFLSEINITIYNISYIVFFSSFDPIFWLCLLHISLIDVSLNLRFQFGVGRAAAAVCGRFQSKQARTRSTSSPAEPFRIRIVFFAVFSCCCSISMERA